jgi:hypothetical protein
MALPEASGLLHDSASPHGVSTVLRTYFQHLVISCALGNNFWYFIE